MLGTPDRGRILSYGEILRDHRAHDRRRGEPHRVRRRVLAEGVVVSTIALFVLVFAGSSFVPLAGATTAAAALMLSQGSENAYLLARRPIAR